MVACCDQGHFCQAMIHRGNDVALGKITYHIVGGQDLGAYTCPQSTHEALGGSRERTWRLGPKLRCWMATRRFGTYNYAVWFTSKIAILTNTRPEIKSVNLPEVRESWCLWVGNASWIFPLVKIEYSATSIHPQTCCFLKWRCRSPGYNRDPDPGDRSRSHGNPPTQRLSSR